MGKQFLRWLWSWIRHPRREWGYRKARKYMRLRAKDVPVETALKKSGFSADGLVRFAADVLDRHLPFVGYLSLGDPGPSSLDVAAQSIDLIGEAGTLASPHLREKWIAEMAMLRDHNWGGIRRPAVVAYGRLTDGN